MYPHSETMIRVGVAKYESTSGGGIISELL